MVDFTRILIVDQDESSNSTVKAFLLADRSHRYDISEAQHLEQVLSNCREHIYDLILLNADFDAIDSSQLIQKFTQERLPGKIIFLVKKDDENKILEAIKESAHEVILHDNLAEKYFLYRINQIIKADRLSNQLEGHENELQGLENKDVLTQLPNRKYFDEIIEHTIARAKRHNRLFAILYIDLDHFRSINESLNHDKGDKLLVETAHRLKQAVRGEDMVMRLWGDEFVVVLPEISEVFDAGKVAKKILEGLTKPFHLYNNTIVISASIGIACYPLAGLDSKTLLKNANAAMCRVKKEGRGHYQFYQADLQDSYMQRVIIENELFFALDRKEFFLCYQPKINIRSDLLTGLEVFLRWNHPKLGELEAEKFIEIAEKTGQIVPIGCWVIKTACKQFSKWKEKLDPKVRLALNISVKQLESSRFPELIKHILAEYDLSASQLEFDFPEQVLIHQSVATASVIRQLHDMGIYITIDDFGSGFSVFKHLRDAPFHALKIDRSFILDLQNNINDAAIVKSLISLGQSLGVSVVAEGVETQEQKEFLLQNSCDHAQGYLFGKPMKANDMKILLENRSIK